MARRGLGRGLGSLIPGLALGMEEGLKELPVSTIVAGRRQPRRRFDEAAMADLVASIASHGVVQPIVVRPCGEQYEIIAGERRWRAALKAGVTVMPAIVRDSDDQQSLQLALIENLQREDISAIEEAEAYKVLVEEYEMSQEEVGQAVGRSRATVSNTLRLLNLPEEIRNAVLEGTLSAGHARAILTEGDPSEQSRLATRIIEESLSVREAEALTREPTYAMPAKPKEAVPEEILETARLIENKLGTKVRVKYTEGRGKIEIHFSDKEELRMLADKVYLLPD